MATLIRVNNIITKDKALNALLSKPKRTKINESLVKIRNLEKIETGGRTPFDKTQIQKLRHKELYIDSLTLNQLHFPISNGDIFKINRSEYILIGQPCNLALRGTGNRDITTGKVYDSAFLLKIYSEKKEKFRNRETFCKTVSLSPLDLTVFNSDGKAIINLNKSEHDSKTIQESWKLRYMQLHEEFSEYRDNIRTFKKLKSVNKSSLKNLIYYGGLFKGYNINNDDVLNRSGNKITFDIQRISYYREPYSSDLLQQFMQYLSRNAFENNFLND